jgi:hypothetical protein
MALSLTICGCSGESGIPAHPKITAGQIEKDAEAGLPSSGSDGAYNKGEIEILESNYSGDKATIVVSAGTINVGSLVPADIEGLKPEIRPKVASIDTIPYELRLDYEWVRGEWRLRRLDNLTFEKR